MSRSRRDSARLPLLPCLAAVLTAAPGAFAEARPAQTPAPPAPAASSSQTAETMLLLDVRVNGWEVGLVGRFYESGGRLSLPADQFDGLGFRLDEALVTTVGEERRVYLDDVPDLAWRIDRASQKIDIQAPFDRLKPNQLRIAPGAPRVPSRADWGVLLSYDAFAEWAESERDLDFSRSLSVNLDARLFSPWFTASSTAYYTIAEDGEEDFVRLETLVDFDSTEEAWRLRLGDSFTAGPIWVRPVRFGGLQWMRNFGLRPDIVTTPMPQISDGVTVPSTIDLFINDVQRWSEAVTPGSIRLTDLPIVTGSNMVRVVVTDQAGRRSEMTLPLYVSPILLAEGMSQFNIEVGSARQNYALVSDDYEGDFASGSLSYGVSDVLTLSGYAAVAEDYGGAAVSAAFPISNLLLVELTSLYAEGPEDTGWAWHISAEHVSPRFSVSGRYIESHGYRDLADQFGYTSFQRKALASVGVDLGRAGHVNFAYAMQRDFEGETNSVASGTWGMDLFRHQMFLSATGYAELEDDQWGVMVSLSFPLGRNVQGYAQHGWENDGTSSAIAQVRGEAWTQRLNWEITDSTDDGSRRTEAVADWEGRYLNLHLAALKSDNQAAYQAGLVQSFVFMENQAFIAGRIDDGFTVVEVEDSPGVRVALENRTIGRTNRHGRIFLPGLQSYAANAVSIDPLDLPPNASIGDPATLVSPRERAGLVTRFAVTRARAALVTVKMPDGSAPPVGAEAVMPGLEEPAMVGFGGEIYLRGLAAGPNRLEVKWRDGGCTVVFNADIAEGSLPRLGPYTCEPSS